MQRIIRNVEQNAQEELQVINKQLEKPYISKSIDETNYH